MIIRLIKKYDVKKCTKLYCKTWPKEKYINIKKYFENKLKNKECFVAIEQENIIGLLGFTKKYFRNSDYLDEVVVDKNFRRMGIAFRLIKKLEEDARKRKIRRIFSSTQPDKPISLNLHKRLGYKKVGYVNHIWKENQKEVFFSKKL